MLREWAERSARSKFGKEPGEQSQNRVGCVDATLAVGLTSPPLVWAKPTLSEWSPTNARLRCGALRAGAGARLSVGTEGTAGERVGELRRPAVPGAAIVRRQLGPHSSSSHAHHIRNRRQYSAPLTTTGFRADSPQHGLSKSPVTTNR